MPLTLFKSYSEVLSFHLYGDKIVMYGDDSKCYTLPDLELVYQTDSTTVVPLGYYLIEVSKWAVEIRNYRKEVIKIVQPDNKRLLAHRVKTSGNLLLIPQMETHASSKDYPFDWLKISIVRDKIFVENMKEIEVPNPDYISGSIAIAFMYEYDRTGETPVVAGTYAHGWDLQQNRKIWESKIADKEYRLERVISVGDDRAAVFFNTYVLCIIHLADGRILWRRDQVELIAAGSDVVYVLDKPSKTYQVLNATDGAVIKSVFLGEKTDLDYWLQDAFIAGDSIIMVALNARAYVLRKEDGTILQEINIKKPIRSPVLNKKDHETNIKEPIRSPVLSRMMRVFSAKCDRSYLYVLKNVERQLDIYTIH